MRDIKFRAWDKKGKGFVNGFNMYGFSTGQGAPKKMLHRFSDEWNMEDVELMQYTGLKDKNGKEIYEGDIVKSSGGSIGSIIFRNSKFMIELCGYLNLYENIRLIEVVGNIYKNPELLEMDK